MKKQFLMLFWMLAIIGLCISVQAEDLQGPLVVDHANVFKGSIHEVERAAQELESVGADVHVWTIPSYSGKASSLKEYFEKLLLPKFPAWQSSNGGKKNNLVVMMISLKEKKTGLYYGEEWSRVLKPNWVRIQTDFMNPHFPRGEFAEGFVAGLGEVRDLIYDHFHPKAVSPQTAPAQPIIINQSAPSKPVDLSGLWAVLKGILIIAVVFTICAFCFLYFRNRRKEREKKQEAQQRAKIQKTSISKKIGDLRLELKEAKELLEILRSSVQLNLIEKYRNNLGGIERRIATIVQNFSATNSSVGDPGNNNLTTAQYSAIEMKFAESSDSVDNAFEALSDSKKLLDELRNDVMKAPKVMAKLEVDSEETKKIFQIVQGKGFKTSKAELKLSKSEGLVEEAKKLLVDKFFTKAIAKANQAESVMLEAQEEVLGLPEIKSKIDLDIEKIENLGPKVVQEISRGRDVFQSLVDEFVSGSLESIKGNGTEAQNRVRAAADFIEQAKAKASMEEQFWAEAEKLVSQAEEYLKQASSLMKSIFSLEKNLKEAKSKVNAEVAEVESDIKKAWKYINQFGDDIRDSLEKDLRRAEDMIAEVKSELSKTKPDYIVAFKTAQKANALADKVYDVAVEEHEAAERARRKAIAQRQSAKAALSRAKEYFEDHRSDIDSDAKNRLRKAEQAFRDSDEGDLAQFIVSMTLCQEESNRAYKMAKSDVSSAESSRNISWGSSTSFPSRKSSINIGGGSTSWGSIGGGGGGDTTWTNIGGGGGGDTSW